MLINIVRCCLSVVVICLWTTTIFAQDTPQQPTNQAPSSVPYYALALLGALIVLVVVFKPSNKDW